MRCKQHFSDHSSSVGVCASCLRERLFLLVAAQAESQAALSANDYDCGRRSDPYPPPPPLPPPLAFPRSVSPYVSRRKSDDAPPWIGGGGPDSDRRFFSTPQVGPASGSAAGVSWKKKRGGKFSLLGSIFRSRSDKPETDPRIPSESCASSSSSPNWWFSSVISGRRKKSSATAAAALDDLPAACRWPPRATNRGMSPEYGEDCEASPWGSGYSPEVWRTPGTGRRRSGNPRNTATGMAFCLSPLVRASPGRQWNQKGMPPDMGYTGETRTVAAASNPHLSTASSLCANRSRKLVDLGRSGHNR